MAGRRQGSRLSSDQASGLIAARFAFPVMAVPFLAVAALLVAVWAQGGAKLALASAIGVGAGIALYHAAFGFTAHWRRFLAEGRGAGFRAQLLLIGLTACITFPLIGWGAMLGLDVRGSVAPLSAGLCVGAFVFGFGMMFAGGCGSGTLFTVGGGSTRMVVTLAAFIAGSVLGTLNVLWWRGLPDLGRYGLVRDWGVVPALGAFCAILAGFALLSIRRERRLHGALEQGRAHGSLVHGPWSLLTGALALAAVSVATLVLLGRPWGITSAFTMWGGKIATAAGVDLASWPYWQTRMRWMESSVWEDATSVMNFGIIAGAMLAASLAGRFRPTLALTARDLSTAILGGLCMGYGARIAYGCNIGGFLGGSISGSVHGLVWMLAALAGSAAALKLTTGRGFAR